MKKKLAMLLLASMLIPSLIACSSGGGAPADTTAADTAAQAGETTAAVVEEEDEGRLSAKNTLDVNALDFNGMTITVGYSDTSNCKTDIIGADDGDVVNEAVYERNMIVEEELNIKFNPIAISTSTSEAAQKLRTLAIAGDHAYDISSTHQAYTSKLLFDNIFHNFVDDEYLAFDQPWWAYEYMKEFTIGDERLFFLFGDIALMMLKSAGATYFNKGLVDEYVKPSDEFYADVLDRNWTLDHLYEYTSKAYKDLNGDGTADAGDQYGMVSMILKPVEHLQYNAGIRTTKRDENGIPQLILNNEKTIKFAEMLYKLFYDNPGARIYTTDEINKEMLNMFKDDRVLFYPNWFYSVDLLRDMESDYGIVPYPMLDEDQDDYMTLVHNGSTMFTVPITIPADKAAIIGAVLEDMAYHAYRLMTPAYFEVAMKEKYSRDAISSQLLDVMYASMYTDFGYCYSSTLNGVGTLRNLASNKTPDFASWYASKEAGAKKALDDLIKLYLEG